MLEFPTYPYNSYIRFLLPEEIVLPPSLVEVEEQRTPPAPPAQAAVQAEVGPSPETRMALAERLLRRPPRSLEEADEALSRAGFQMSPGRPH